MSTVKKLVESFVAVVIMASCILLRPLLRRWYSAWGTTEDETVMELPGDEFVPHRISGYTQTVAIRAPVDSVWPWVAQTGQGRGGYYSYELLENLVGCDIHNTNRILPEYQDIKVGDTIIMHPKVPAIPVVIVEPGKTLALGGRQDKDTANIWIFFITRKGSVTRLISRWSFEYKPVLVNKIIYNWLIEPIAVVMQRKMLLTIKQLAETNAAL
jgi:hypothetical protein